MLRVNLANFLAWQGSAHAATANKFDGARGFGSAKSVIMVFLQGGPSHIDLWDPKPEGSMRIPSCSRSRVRIPFRRRRLPRPSAILAVTRVVRLTRSGEPAGL